MTLISRYPLRHIGGLTGVVGVLAWPWSCVRADLNDVPGMNEAQRNVAAATQSSWNQVTSLEPFDPTQRDFVMSVNALVQTSFVQQGDQRANTEAALPMTESELRGALQDFAHEEVATQGTGLTEVAGGQLANVAARQRQLRMGTQGVGRPGLALKLNPMDIPPPYLLAEASALQILAGAFSSQLDPFQRGNLQIADTGTPPRELYAQAGQSDNGRSDLAQRWGTFVNGSFSTGEKDATSREEAFDFDTWSLTGGVDYRLTDRLLAGAAIGYATAESDLANNGGDLDTESLAISLYSSLQQNNLYLDAIASFGRNDYESRRNIEYTSMQRTAEGDTDGNQFALSIGAGYNQLQDRLEYGLYARLDYLDADIDGYDETGAAGLSLSVEEQHVRSLQSVLGARAAYTINQNYGVLVPYARADWHHEFKDESRDIQAVFVHDPFASTFSVPTDEADKNFFTLGLGFSLVVEGGMQVFLDYETPLALDDIENHSFTLGVRAAF